MLFVFDLRSGHVSTIHVSLHVLTAVIVPGCVHVCLHFAVGAGSSGVCMFHVLILMSILVLNWEVPWASLVADELHVMHYYHYYEDVNLNRDSLQSYDSYAQYSRTIGYRPVSIPAPPPPPPPPLPLKMDSVGNAFDNFEHLGQ